jgi:hypothetical protein
MSNIETNEAANDELRLLGGIKNMLDRKVMPRQLPEFYGPNPWMVGLTKTPKIVPDTSEIAQSVSLSFELRPVFTQTKEQEAYTSAILSQAATQSTGGLRKTVESDKFQNERNTAFVGAGIELVANMTVVGAKEADDYEAFYGALWQIPLDNVIDKEWNFEDKELQETMSLLSSAAKLRVNTFFKTLVDGVQAYAAVVSQVAQQSASASGFDLENEEAAAGLTPMNTEEMLARQQQQALMAIDTVYRDPTKVSNKIKDVSIKVDGLEDLMLVLLDLEPHFDSSVEFTNLVDFTIFQISELTQFTNTPSPLFGIHAGEDASQEQEEGEEAEAA